MKGKRVKRGKSYLKMEKRANELYILKSLSKPCIRLCTPSSIPYFVEEVIRND